MKTIQDYIAELEDTTLTLLQQIDRVNYEELLSFAEKREALVNIIISFKENLVDQDRKRLKDLFKYDTVIMARMEHFKREASEWLLNRETIKDQRMAYNAGYTPDSMFFDRKN